MVGRGRLSVGFPGGTSRVNRPHRKTSLLRFVTKFSDSSCSRAETALRVGPNRLQSEQNLTHTSESKLSAVIVTSWGGPRLPLPAEKNGQRNASFRPEVSWDQTPPDQILGPPLDYREKSGNRLLSLYRHLVASKQWRESTKITAVFGN